MASSLTVSGFRPPFWPTRTGTATQLNTVSGGLFTDSDTFFDGLFTSIAVDGGLLQDADTFFGGVLSNTGQIFGSKMGDSLEVISSTSSRDVDTSHTVNIPNGSHIVGRLVFVAISADDTPTCTFPTGWTELFDSASSMVALCVGYRVIDGTEGFSGSNDSITVTTSSAQVTTHVSYLIKNFSGTPQASVTSGINNTPDSNSITPSGGFDNYLFLSIHAHDSGLTTTTAFPSGYASTLQKQSGGVDGCGIGSAYTSKTVSTEDPGSFTIDQTRNWVAATVSIRSAEVAHEDVIFQGSLISGVMEGSTLSNTSTINGGDIYHGVNVTTADRGITQVEEDPDVYTLDAARDWISVTVAVKGT